MNLLSSLLVIVTDLMRFQKINKIHNLYENQSVCQLCIDLFFQNKTTYTIDLKEQTDRTCKVLIESYTSNIKVLENGVSQGAILSPTLFLISMESLLRTTPTNIDTFI